jgi:hypothetical protein
MTLPDPGGTGGGSANAYAVRNLDGLREDTPTAIRPDNGMKMLCYRKPHD